MLNFDSSFERVRLFKSDQLEKMTLISPRTFVITWSILLPFLAWLGWGTTTTLETLLYVGSGLIFWAFFEYAMHRYLFHLDVDVKFVRWCVYLMHGNHHEYPNDPLRNLMPLSVSLPISGLLWILSYAVVGMAGSWFILGFLIGYIGYDTIHYACHQWPMRSSFARALKQHHMRHHYVDKAGNYAISTIFVDRLFGTHIRSVKGRKSATAALEPREQESGA